MEGVFQHNLRWHLTIRLPKHRIQSEAWEDSNKMQDRLQISIRVNPRYLHHVP